MPKILIVDDKKENRDVLKDFFRFFGRRSPIELFEADSGKDAVREALSIKPDLVLMDLNMETPYAGLEATKEIKNNLPDENILIWAVTSQAMRGYENEDSDEEKCLKSGVDKYISKPFDQKELLFEVSKVLNLPIPDRVKKIFLENE